MKRNKRIVAMLLSALAILMLLPMQTLAAGSLNLSRDVSLTISYQYGEIPLVDAQFDLYLVVTVDEDGELTPTEDFAPFHVDLRGQDDEAWRALASALEGYVLRDHIPPTDSGRTDEQGLVYFPNEQERLTPGLYLVLGHRHTQDGYVYDAAPFFVMLPGFDEKAGVWVYDETANAKYNFEPVPEEPGTVTRKVLKVWQDAGYEMDRPEEIVVQLLRDDQVYDTVTLSADNNWRYTWTDLDSSYRWIVVENELKDYTVQVTQEGITFVVTNTYSGSDNPQPAVPDSLSGPKLPQTGQLWWPVPVLASNGLLLLVIGLIRRRGAADET